MKIKYFLITAVLVTAILCFGGAVNAQTDNSALIAQLQAQIQLLMQQIQQLTSQQGGQSWCHTFNNYSVAGSTSGDVTYLQTALTKQGFDVSGDTQGIFSDDTAAAVVQFQSKYGIKQTGTVGPLTRAKLNSFYGCTTSQPTPNPTPMPDPTSAPTVTFTASNAETGQNYDTYSAINLPYGQIVNLTYSSSNATTCNTYANSTLMNSTTIGLTQGATSGLWQGQPKPGMTVVYMVTCQNASGKQASQSITVIAANAPITSAPTVTFTASNAETGQNYDTTNTINLPYGQIVNFNYSSANATSCYAYANSTLMNSTTIGLTQGLTSGIFQSQPKPGNTVTYTITCWSNGQQASQNITVSAANAPATLPPTVIFTASNAETGQNYDTSSTISLPYGQIVNFTYSSTNATTCNAYANSTPMNNTSVGLTQGAITGAFQSQPRPGTTTTYTITCLANGQQVSKNITVSAASN